MQRETLYDSAIAPVRRKGVPDTLKSGANFATPGNAMDRYHAPRDEILEEIRIIKLRINILLSKSARKGVETWRWQAV